MRIACYAPIILCGFGALLLACSSSANHVRTAAPRSPTPVSGRVAIGLPSQPPRATPAAFAPATPASRFAPGAATPAPLPTRAPDDILRFVGKQGDPLPADYVPPDLVPLPAQMSAPPGLLLRAEAASHFEQMWQVSRADGVDFVAVSTYRSYQDQVQVYANEVATFGQAKADSESAQPGRSEHQLGLAIDLSSAAYGFALDDTFGQSPEGSWVAQHAADFGFVVSYPEGKDAITGYRYEPWHIRYVGVEAARAIVASGKTSTEVLQSWRTINAGPTPLPATPTP